jgi:hypothetical protein
MYIRYFPISIRFFGKGWKILDFDSTVGMGFAGQ